jgi:hypothetical protein
MASRVIALVEHPSGEKEGHERTVQISTRRRLGVGEQ